MSTATKLEYLNDTKGLLKDSINSLGGNITSQTTFRQYATELDSIYSNLPKVSGTGSNISLSPTLKGRLNIIPRGNTLQSGTPTPTNPINIQYATEVQNINVFSGENVFDFSQNIVNKANNVSYTKTDDTLTVTNQVAGSNMWVAMILGGEELLGKKITMKSTMTGTTGGIKIYYLNDFNNPISSEGLAYRPIVDNYTVTLSNTFPSGATKVGVLFYSTFSQSPSGTEMIFKDTKIYKINTDTQIHEEYEINLKTNKMYSEDYITGTPDNWSIVRNNGEITLDGTEKWNYYSVAQGSLFRNNTIITDSSSDITYIPLSNYYEGIPFSQQQSRQNNQFYIKQSEGELDILDNRFTSVDDFKTFLRTNTPKIIYKLATPTTETIIDTDLISDLNALYNIQSYDEVTNISVEGDLPMILTASALKGEA